MRHKLFIMFIALLVLFFFKNAFSIGFFKDDLFFLNISKANSLADFLNFFNPYNHSGYRPVPIEVFYYLINTFRLNFFIIHLIIFATYIAGVFFLYKSLLHISRNIVLTLFTVFLYSIHLTHVFQLYAIWNFQEVCLFTFLSLSFYYLLTKKYYFSLIFYILALLSKETAIFYPALVFFSISCKKIGKFNYKFSVHKYYLFAISILSLVFLLIYKNSLVNFTQNALYTPHWNIRLIVNNSMWYGLWSLGFPTYLPDYMVSIFKPPLPDFYKALATLESRLYFYLLLVYYVVIISGLLYLLINPKNRKTLIKIGLFSLLFFFIFTASTLPMIHKWMVRLTIPLIFVCLFQATIISKLFNQSRGGKIVAGFLIGLYLVWNYYGTIVHESASTIKLESAIYFKSKSYFDKNRNKALTKKYIYIKDFKKGTNPWGGSRKLNDTYWGQNFVKYIFPEKNITMLYQFETPKIPKNAFVVRPIKLLPY